MSNSGRTGIWGVLFYGATSALAQQLAPAPYLDVSSVPLAPSHKAGFVPTINSAHRGEVIATFYSRFVPSDAVPIQWTGSIGTCNAGQTSAAYAQATLDRVNYYRALAGVPDNIVMASTLSARNQQAALMFSANNKLDHSPTSDWACYTAQGAQGAGSSNISLGAAGPAAIDIYMEDGGSGNAAAGHRRWILYPRETTMGTGSVEPPSTYASANALWVLDTSTWTTPPALPNGVAWPAAGYLPYLLLPMGERRWSFTYSGADFGAATVAVTRGGTSLTTAAEAIDNGYGDNTLVWRMPGVPLTAPAQDTTYHVSLSNVLVGGSSRSFAYDVTVIDPVKPPALRDFSGKGISDVVWRQLSTGQNIAWLMRGSTASSAFGLGGDTNWHIATVVDLNADGHADVLWEYAPSGAVVAKLMNGSAVLGSGLIGGGGGWHVWATGDFNRDGKADIVWRQSSNGATAIALMNGTSVISQAIVGGSVDWQVAETGDFDGDGRTDLLWRQQSTGALLVHFMNGLAVTRSAFVTFESGGWSVIGSADFDGDGKDDLLFRHAASGATVLWTMNGESVTSSSALGGDANWTPIQTADFNGDGKADLLWRNIDGAVVLWLMNGTTATSSSYIGGSLDWIPVGQ